MKFKKLFNTKSQTLSVFLLFTQIIFPLYPLITFASPISTSSAIKEEISAHSISTFTIYTPFTNYTEDTRGIITTNLTFNGQTVATYTYQKGGTSRAEARDKEKETGKLTYTVTNYLGTPVLQTNENGEITQAGITDVFGNYIYRDISEDEEATTTATTTPIQNDPEPIITYGGTTNPELNTKSYTGHTYDDVTDLTYANARYLDTAQHSFTSVDPIIYNLSQDYLLDPQQQNSYAYARNNPVTNTDPTGKWYKEVLSGNQSWSDFMGEVGQATQYMGSMWQTAMDRWYVPAIVGSTPLIVYGGSVAVTQIITGTRLGTLGSLPMLDRVDKIAEKGFDAIQKATGLAKSEAIQIIQSTGKSLVEMRSQNFGNINNVANVGDKIIRITTTPDASKIISSGVLGSVSKLQQYITSGAMKSIPIVTSIAKTLTKFISNLIK